MIKTIEELKDYLQELVDVFGVDDDLILFKFENLFKTKKISLPFVRGNMGQIIEELRKIYSLFNSHTFILKFIDEYDVFDLKHYPKLIKTLKELEKRTENQLDEITGGLNVEEFIEQLKSESEKYFEIKNDEEGLYTEEQKQEAEQKIEELGRLAKLAKNMTEDKKRYAGIILNILLTREYQTIDDFIWVVYECYNVFPEIFHGTYESLQEVKNSKEKQIENQNKMTNNTDETKEEIENEEIDAILEFFRINRFSTKTLRDEKNYALFVQKLEKIKYKNKKKQDKEQENDIKKLFTFNINEI